MSSWTQAIVTHNSNTVSTGSGSVALRVALTGGGGTPCNSTDGADNTTTCSIDLLGNLGAAVTNLQPGGTATTSVTLANTGDANATTLNIAPGPCTGSAALCSNLLVSMTCTGDATKSFALGTMDAFGASDGNFSAPLPKLVGATVCVFAISLP